MQIVTLTTDFGLHDHYVASLKGAILKEIPTAYIIDISHSIKAFNVSNAAFQIKSCFASFPDNTIHIIAVDTEPKYNIKSPSTHSVMCYKNQFFIGNNNGFFGSFLDGKSPDGFYEISSDIFDRKNYRVFPSKNCFVPVAGKIFRKEKFNQFLKPQDTIKKAYQPIIKIESNKLTGHVIHIDAFGNIISNIKKEDFETIGNEIPFTIYYANRSHFIDKISESYNEVVDGEKIALFNDNELLEIAINKGVNGVNAGANRLFGVKLGDLITIEFNAPGSVNDIQSLF